MDTCCSCGVWVGFMVEGDYSNAAGDCQPLAVGYTDPMADLWTFLERALALKTTPRAGWARCGVPAPESVADHSYGVALLALVLAPRHPGPLDGARCLRLALAHDLAEALVGDITPHDGVPPEAKARREAGAVAELSALLGDAALESLWREYEAARTPEARFVKSLDKLEMLCQARAYERAHPKGPDLEAFWLQAEAQCMVPPNEGAYPDAFVRGLVGELLARRRQERV